MITRPRSPLLFLSVLTVALALASGLAACRAVATEPFAITLLADESITGPDLYEIELDQLPLADEPLITSAGLVAYRWEDHQLELTPEAYGRLQEIFPLPVRVHGIPFVVTVGAERIYAGAFWTPLSSLSFDGVVIMQPFEPEPTPIHIVRGYPGPDFVTGPDPRDDPRIHHALQEAGLLR